MLGWGLAALVGALAGVLVAPRLFLDVNLMGRVLIYSFAAATLGGFDSPLGAVVGGWIIGVTETLAGTYVDFIGADLKILVPLAGIIFVLLVRPPACSARPRWRERDRTRAVALGGALLVLAVADPVPLRPLPRRRSSRSCSPTRSPSSG